MIVAGTGHRPDKLGGYDGSVFAELTALAERWLRQHPSCFTVISGMALGWDQALATAAGKLGLELVAVVPFRGQESRWPQASRDRFEFLLAISSRVVYVCESFSKTAFQERNEWMVDNCHRVLALWDGSSGGTGNCVRYAKKVRRPIDNLWEEWSNRQ